MNEEMTTKKLDAIYKLLAPLMDAAQKTTQLESPLGLQMAPVPTYIYVGEGPNRRPWYFVKDSIQIAIVEDSLVGRIVHIAHKVKTSERGDKDKLQIGILADKKYVLQSGLTTEFSKSLLQALLATSADELSRVCRLIIRPGESTKVAFASLMVEDVPVRASKDHVISSAREALDAIEAIAMKLGTKPSESQSKEQSHWIQGSRAG